MSTLEEEYKKIELERKKCIKQINELENDEKVKTYFNLCQKNDQLASQQKELYKQIKNEEYSTCNHIWVTTLHNYDGIEGRSYNYCGCIKCGLDQSVLHIMDNCNSLNCLTLEQQAMYNYMNNNYYYKTGINIKMLCNLDLARAIYRKIRFHNQNINDETVRKYFEIALYNIRNNKVTEERKTNRAKRLSLYENFNNWNN